MTLPLVILTGTTTTLREAVARALLLRSPGLVAVAYELDPSAEGALLRSVADGRRTVEERRLAAGCCLACAVREDLPDVLVQVEAQHQGWTKVLVVLPTAVPASAVLPALAEDQVEAVVCAVDGLLLRGQLSGDGLLADAGLAAAPTDRRAVAEMVVGHLEEADSLAVGHLHRLPADTAATVEAVLAHLAPLAQRVVVGAGGVGCEDVLDAGPRLGDDERAVLTGLAADLCAPACGVTTLLWRSDRPLHPARLAAALPDLVVGLLRSRGELWLADRPDQQLRWEQAGGSVSLGPAGTHSPPCTELLITGLGIDAADLRQRLDACRATPDEQAHPDWEDPFADALGPAPSRLRTTDR